MGHYFSPGGLKLAHEKQQHYLFELKKTVKHCSVIDRGT
jgi:hypothetical protein